MLQLIKNKLNKINQWYDDKSVEYQIYPAAGFALIGVYLTMSNSVILSWIGLLYFFVLFSVRWAYLNGKV